MSTITATHPVFGDGIGPRMTTAKGQQVLAYLNASSTAQTATAAMVAEPVQQIIHLRNTTEYNPNANADNKRVAPLSDSDWNTHDAGTIAIRLIHEIRHARDPVPPANVANFSNPDAYAKARAGGEGSAFSNEYMFLREIQALNAIQPLASLRFPIPPTTVDAAATHLPPDQRQYVINDIQSTEDAVWNAYSDPAQRTAAMREALEEAVPVLKTLNEVTQQ
jgi:hypothetical protein